ncbi:extracellular solute-binding protein [Aquitalea aquatilis]|uniref:extracellular solute-binding protein n=1 Tax=Aquitalea aquatilis TaxID=1537400 RepID=UPI0010BD24F2|nr:extracellular solute-binding protein [Aquitalea aquatilis]
MKQQHWLGVLLLLWAARGMAAPAQAMGYTPKYAAGFTHFDYVEPQAPKGGQLVLPAQGSFDTLNPFTLKGDKADGVQALLLDTLGVSSEDEPYSCYGLLADDMQLAADKLSVRFHLNPLARFANGRPLQAADVVASFNTLTRDPAATPLYRLYWADVKQAIALDAATVRFDFKRKNSELHMTLCQLPVFSRQWIAAGKSLADVALLPPVGSGPYVLERYDLGKNISFKRNPQYWAAKLPVRKGMFNFDRISYRYYQDETARLEAFKAGEFDVSAENMAKQWARGYAGAKFDDGRIIKKALPHQRGAGMQGFVFNLRRQQFADKRLRQAISLAFDFEWANRNLFYGQYRRSNSFFTNSDLAASGLPGPDELKLLNPIKDKLDPLVFGQPVEPPFTDGRYGIRRNLRQARQLLFEAGWRYEGGLLVDHRGRPLRIEFLTYSKVYDRVASGWQQNLAKLGITLTVRLVDPAIYQRRLNDFDYDMTVVVYGASNSPGNEQLDFHSCQAAQTPGSQNWAGLCDPAVEALLPNFQQFADRRQLQAASRALDRVLRAGYYLLPNWYLPYYRMAWWNRFGQPAKLPLYYSPTTWAIETWWEKK